MEYKLFKNLPVILILFTTTLFAQYNGNDFGIYLAANYTTSARFFLNPDATQKLIREDNVELVDNYSGSIEFRYRLTESIIIGLGTEYIEKVSKERNVIGFHPQLAGVEVEEGYRMIPVEASIYYFIPFSTDDLKFYMGGGLGIYFGEYIRDFANVSLENTGRDFAWGIHGRMGMDYMVTNYFSVRGEMKFRDPDFRMESKYNKEFFVFRGEARSLPQEPFPTKVNIDGMTFAIGLVFHF
ncbi:MAG: hypothetical protein QY331_13090 [Melioribacteraceae bacterium]|nr:hypothetical protein [Melioribacteraceae bacterium]WKZ68888.1 MAG: hypothetical protein QY331_13090 [Melioribacteraceae bacterium]